VVNIEANDPFAKEKAITPTSMIIEQKTISRELVPEMSP
jgi:hypothetical protein